MQTREPANPAASFELERFLPYRLSLLTNTVSQGIAARYRDAFGISVTEWRILAVLGRFPGLTASEVVARTAMDKVAIHRGVKALVAGGLVERRTDEGDRRRQTLHITRPRGQAIIEDIIPRARQFERQLLQALTREESAFLQRILEKLQASAEDALGDSKR
ncbi:MAG: MarR family winged helix-turn-helix transcriptional regulator [Xanthomonadales bacterium]